MTQPFSVYNWFRQPLRVARGFFWFVLFCLLLLPALEKCGAQTLTHISGLIVDSAIKARLAEEWTDSNRYQHEREYCLQYQKEEQAAGDGRAGITWYRLTAILRAREDGTTPGSIYRYACPLGTMATLHIHTPTTCDHTQQFNDGSACVVGGVESNECFPSDYDLLTLQKTGYAFFVIQCDRNALVPVFRNLYFK